MASTNVDIKKTIRGSVPRIPYEEMACAILGPRYELSLVICGDALAQRMNREYRGKTYRPNVLSFPLSKKEGEIFLNLRCAAREALPAGRQGARLSKTQREKLVRNRTALLYVHALWHLKGLDHGATMERKEAATLKHFGF
jgi:rRNA maturation RNase YbeY